MFCQVSSVKCFERGKNNSKLQYLNQLPKLLDEPSLEDVHAMAQKYIKPDQWTWLIVGDLSKIEEPIRKLNLGPVEVLD